MKIATVTAAPTDESSCLDCESLALSDARAGRVSWIAIAQGDVSASVEMVRSCYPACMFLAFSARRRLAVVAYAL